jgi:hypothetical protein
MKDIDVVASIINMPNTSTRDETVKRKRVVTSLKPSDIRTKMASQPDISVKKRKFFKAKKANTK